MGINSVFYKAFNQIRQGLPSKRISMLRAVGYGAQTAWMLSVFYTVFSYSLLSNSCMAIYLNQLVSQAALVAAIFVIILFVRHIYQLLSNTKCILGSCTLLALATVMLIFVDPASQFAILLITISAVLTGVSSGFLAIAWMKLFVQAGAALAIIELPLSWLLAAVFSMALRYLPELAACITTAVLAITSGIFILLINVRQATSTVSLPATNPTENTNYSVSTDFAEQADLVQADLTQADLAQIDLKQVEIEIEALTKERLPLMVKKRLVRGFYAAISFGFVAGFADIISGFSPFTYNENYGFAMLVGTMFIVLIVLVLGILLNHQTIVYVSRISFMATIIGCLLISFTTTDMTYPNIIIFGGYIGFLITSIVIAIGICNYYKSSCVKTVGLVLCGLYFGELLGNALAFGIGSLDNISLHLGALAFVLCSILLAVNFFIFTEKDLIELRVGQFSDNDKAESDQTDGLEWLDSMVASLAQRYKLTARESDVLPLLLRGRTIARIQEELHISPGTVNTHIRHIYTKIGIANRQELLDLIEQNQKV